MLRGPSIDGLERVEQRFLTLPERERPQTPGQRRSNRGRSNVSHRIFRHPEGTFPEDVRIQLELLLGIFDGYNFVVVSLRFGIQSLRKILLDDGQELIAAHPAQGEEQKRIAIELFAQQKINRGQVLTRVGRIRAGTAGYEVLLVFG